MTTFIKVTADEAAKYFDFCMTLVDRGYTFLIQTEKGNVIIAPVASQVTPDLEELEAHKAAQYAPMGPPPPIPGVTLPSDDAVRGYVSATINELTKDF